MFLRSLAVTVSLTALTMTPAQAGWFEREKPRTEEMQHMHHSSQGSAKSSKQSASTRAYAQAMHVMHKRMRAPRSGNVDVDFARQMIPHHQAAVAMARAQQKYGRDADLKRFNDWVIQAQEVEIAMMQNWLRRRDNGVNSRAAEDHYGEVMKKMHHAMAVRYTGKADVDYVRGMIAHHQGAVDMAAILLAEGTDPELNDLANNVFDSQTYEIGWMQDWLEEHGYAAR